MDFSGKHVFVTGGSRGIGRAVAAAGKPLFVYTCNTSRKVDLALAAGASGVMSDRPGWLAGILADHEMRP